MALAGDFLGGRALFCADGLDVLCGLPASSVDLVATDPPFNKGRVFDAAGGSVSEGASFDDCWEWGEASVLTLDGLRSSFGVAVELVELARRVHGDGMAAYLCFMLPRLIELRRVLKPTGSLYLHCDQTASHYLKQLLDAVFGRGSFRREITWKRTHAKGNATRCYPNLADSIFFYSAGGRYTFNPQFSSLGEGGRTPYRHDDGDGRLYRLVVLTAPGRREDRMFRFMGVVPGRSWCFGRERMEQMRREGLIVQSRPGGMPEYKRYLDESRGVAVGNVWTDVRVLGASSGERTGYPTQKPVALYERIIRASSNEGDLVLDPFMGSGTTLVAAERLARRWIGVDESEDACAIALRRMREEGLGVGEGAGGLHGDVRYVGRIGG